MKINNLLIGLGLALTFAGCSKDLKNSPTPPKTGDTTASPPAPVPYSITEGFEQGSKTAYAAADVTLSTGSWNFNDALIGSLAADLKDVGRIIRQEYAFTYSCWGSLCLYKAGAVLVH